MHNCLNTQVQMRQKGLRDLLVKFSKRKQKDAYAN